MEKELDWGNLSFGYIPTDYNVRCYYRNGQWGEIEVSSSETINIHIAATALHYGQEIFEGLKAFRGKDGKVRIFRLEENAKRIIESAKGIKMQPIPVELFTEMVKKVVKLNERFVPPYGSGASLYIRPLEIGTSAQVGVKPSQEYLFLILVTPVGPYFKEGFRPTNICIMREFDRVAPKGTGRWKVGGNYAASLDAGERAHSMGYSAVLYLDPKEHKFIDEFSSSNFFGIKNNTYITPDSHTVLPSITNKSLEQVAKDLGYKTERRAIPVEELATFEEVGECGTAVVITPVNQIDDKPSIEGSEFNTIYKYAKECGPVSRKLYDTLVGIQRGEKEDIHNWCVIL